MQIGLWVPLLVTSHETPVAKSMTSSYAIAANPNYDQSLYFGPGHHPRRSTLEFACRAALERLGCLGGTENNPFLALRFSSLSSGTTRTFLNYGICRDGQMIFDSLTHVTHDGRWFETGLNASEVELLKQMDEAGAQRAVLVGLAGYIDNHFVLEVCQRYPSRLIPCASFNPVAYSTPRQSRLAFRRELHNQSYRAWKLHPRLNRYNPLDPRCIAVLEELSSFGRRVPVWLDTLFYYRGGFMAKPVVDTIHELVGTFSSLTFVLLHAGGTWIAHLAEAIRDCPNAFLDLSFTLHRYRSTSLSSDIRNLVATFDRRLIFGSDFPEVSISSSLQSFHELTAGLPKEKCANVLGANLGRILSSE